MKSSVDKTHEDLLTQAASGNPNSLRLLSRKDDVIIDNWKNYPENFSNNMVEYQKWFDECDSLKSCVAKGEIDFHNRILTPDIYKILGDPREKIALDIGFGGGRLVLASSKVFKNVIGIDVLSEKLRKMTEKFLDSQGTNNYELLDPDSMLKIESNSVDFVYSYIVFQHFSSIDYFHKYMDLIRRVLKPGGVGNIFFGLCVAKNPGIHQVVKEDGFYHWHEGFKTGNRRSTLCYDPSWVHDQIENHHGMKIAAVVRFTKQPWSNSENLSSQFCVKFVNKGT